MYRSVLFLSGELNRVTLQTSPVGSSGTATVAASSAANLVSMPITGCLAAGEEPYGIRPGFALSRLVWLCREDHLWVESHRLLAYGLGLLVRHGVTPCCERFRCSTMAAGCCWTTTATSSRSRRTARALRSRHESPTRAAIVGSD